MVNEGEINREGEKTKIPKLEIRAKSVASERHPDRNEDALFQLPNAVGVFDGLGGYAAGDKASRIAKEQVIKSLSTIQKGRSLQETEEKIRQTLIDANSAVYKEGTTKDENKGMGTTASVVYIWEGPTGEKKAIVGNVGDSRVYSLKKDGEFEQITLDDNNVRSAMPTEKEARQLQSKLNNITNPQTQLTKSEQDLFNSRNRMDQALGDPTIEPRINTINFQTGDTILACSDGISDNLTDIEISAILNSNKNNDKAIQVLIEASQGISRSNLTRSKRDDMTAIIIRETNLGHAKEIHQPQNAQTTQENKEIDTTPLSLIDIEKREIDFKIAGAGSIAELLDIITTDIKNGIQLEPGITLSNKDLQLKILRGIIKKTPEDQQASDPIGLQKKISDLADNNLFPIRSRLDWMLLDIAKSQPVEEGGEKILWTESERLWNLNNMMTSKQKKQEIVDHISEARKLVWLPPLEAVQKTLEEGRQQKVIGKDAYNRTPEFKMAEQLGKQAYILREELEGENIERQPMINLKQLNEDNVMINKFGRIFFFRMETPYTFDPRKLAMGILAGDIDPLSEQKIALGEKEETVHAYYPHYNKENMLIGKTEFIMPLHDARFLLKKSFNELGLTEKAVNASLDTYNILINTADPEYQELHRYSAAPKLR